MDMSDGKLFELHRVITFLLLFRLSSVYADHSPTLQSPPPLCFEKITVCLLSVEYPLTSKGASNPWISNGASCGYPGFDMDCDPNQYERRPYINISNHIYHVLHISYEFKFIRLVDIEVEGSGCHRPKRNFSFPSSPSWVNYQLFDPYNVTIFYNYSRVPAYAEEHLLCSKEEYKPQTLYFLMLSTTIKLERGLIGTATALRMWSFRLLVMAVAITKRMKSGFDLKWYVTDWCEDCERSGGHCWSISTATGCACKNGKSYNTTCPQGIFLVLKYMTGVFAGIGLVFLVVLLRYIKKKFQMNENKSPIDVKAFLESYGCLALHRYTYLDIQKITNSFKDKLGEGGYGQVFKGKLRDGRMVAAKVMNESKGDGEDFINEVATIGRTNHVNVVTLVGFCIEGKRRVLVYEFMPNGSLERFIYTQKEPTITSTLGWEKLYEITLGIARWLEYLHRGCNTRILHFDIKPHNILLDKDFCPKISDFGLAKLYPTRESVVSTVGARGTMGYIAPELCCRNFGSVSHKSDVYSYGMMMLEMIGGRKNIDTTVENISEIYFPFWIYNHLMRNHNVEELKDIQAREVLENEKAKKMIIVALWCIQALPMERPSMSRVVEMLEGNTHDLRMPPNPSLDLRASSSTSL